MMKYKNFHIILVVCYATILILSEVLIYYFVGEETLEQGGTISSISLWLPFILGVPTTLLDYGYFKLYEKKNNDHKKD